MMEGASPYRLPVIYDEPVAEPEPAPVSCEDCRWFGGTRILGSAMTSRSCYVWSTDPYRGGDQKLHDLRDEDYDTWIELRQAWNFNADYDCSTFAHRNPLKRGWVKRLTDWIKG